MADKEPYYPWEQYPIVAPDDEHLGRQGMIGVKWTEDGNKFWWFTPHAMTWGLQDISMSTSGRDQGGLMHKERLKGAKGQKVKIELTFSGVPRQEAARILQKFNPEYIWVNYPNPMTRVYDNDGKRTSEDLTRTAEFYVGDRSAPVWMWQKGQSHEQQIFETISFNLIER